MSWPILWSFYYYTGSSEISTDCAAADWGVHVTAQPNEVVILPFEIHAQLLNSPLWAAHSLIPLGSNPPTDGPTGLDQVSININTPWGIDPMGRPYFDDEGATAANPIPIIPYSGDQGTSTSDIVHAYIDNSGNPYLQ